MEKKQNTQVEIHEENREKRKYISPTLDVMIVEMECGIAANSAAVSPLTIGGNTDQVQTDWNGNDDTTIHTEY
ncbi:hypothetical protein BAX97_11935 [Elizabethkingia meningoseptica]|uniref:hypothetical protein n=1 Tax=Elizabethkingia meningoseptica TaxID=238 RepID=UPI000935BB88|nr:hypothetical protein [Elizabethkingia meningoseptica]MDV3550074.1 hypothetical protein [Elizabethkingia anophelis]MDV3563670.1 hypothetical protein [Elizabethkingia anophelis]MDV3624923.1 hypothetical protein [Elizabethkingia anophelis]MDV3640710.1 hypothetical protein [Elizabethkingia anophelis]MDV3657878.1 hypothetical protein [Elizabethkingia anophelis]